MKGEKMVKRSSFGSIVRKRLSDITNSQSQQKLVTLEEKQPSIHNSMEDLINQLLKEKASLIKLIEERDKIIALSDNQLRNLRNHYQKLQLQNWNLAQSNSQMLAEINLGREKLKTLQHELVCKDALLKARSLNIEGKADVNGQNSGSQEGEKKNTVDELQKANKDIKPSSRIKRRTARSQSMAPSTTSRQGLEKEKVENKRRCLRRQSASFKSQERKQTENLFEIEDVKFAITQQPLDIKNKEKVNLTLPGSSAIKEETCDSRNEAQAAQRSSLGRPMRRAAEKVQSYKEIPLNIKMRRTE